MSDRDEVIRQAAYVLAGEPPEGGCSEAEDAHYQMALITATEQATELADAGLLAGTEFPPRDALELHLTVPPRELRSHPGHRAVKQVLSGETIYTTCSCGTVYTSGDTVYHLQAAHERHIKKVVK